MHNRTTKRPNLHDLEKPETPCKRKAVVASASANSGRASRESASSQLQRCRDWMTQPSSPGFPASPLSPPIARRSKRQPDPFQRALACSACLAGLPRDFTGKGVGRLLPTTAAQTKHMACSKLCSISRSPLPAVEPTMDLLMSTLSYSCVIATLFGIRNMPTTLTKQSHRTPPSPLFRNGLPWRPLLHLPSTPRLSRFRTLQSCQQLICCPTFLPVSDNRSIKEPPLGKPFARSSEVVFRTEIRTLMPCPAKAL